MLYFIFWLSLLILFYTFIGYAVLIFLLSKIIAKKASKQNIFPKVSVVIAAYNEEKVIAQRLKNLLGLDYPKEKLEILIVSDGSTDSTAEICCKFNVENIRLIEQKERSGKALCLNEAVPLSNGDIVVFSDARQRF